MVGTVFKVLQAITKAVSTVFEVLQVVAKVVSILYGLREALDDEHERKSSCRQRDGLVLLVCRLPTTCLVDLGAGTGATMESMINRLAARDHPRASKPKQVKPQKVAAKSNKKNGGSNKINQLAARTNKPARKQVNAANAPQKYAAKNNNTNNNNDGQNKRTNSTITSLMRRTTPPAP